MNHPSDSHSHPRLSCPGAAGRNSVSRRRFLNAVGAAGAAAAGMIASGCKVAPQRVAPAVAPGTATVKPAAPAASRPRVAVAQAMTYDRAAVRKQVRDLIDQTGGLKGIVKSGDRVAIKVNMTGGVKSGALPGIAPIDSFITHPNVVRPLVEAVKEAGAREVLLVEAAYEYASWVDWGFEELAKEMDVKLIDLNLTAPYPDFASVAVGPNAFIYPEFTFNHILEEVDVFMSVPKMKCHYAAGITLSMKNLVGLAPYRFYTLKSDDSYRSGFHGATEDVTQTRLPRVIIDLNRARPIHFALIDGIKSAQGGEGPWIGAMSAIEPHLLVAGASPLATDAVGAALMGFDATAASRTGAFVRSDNHFNIAREAGLGTNILADIDVVGAPIKDVAVKFKTA